MSRNDILMNYDYPGNIRELEGIMENVLIFQESNTIRSNDLPAGISCKTDISEFSAILNFPWKEAKQLFEKMYIENKLGKTSWNITEAAKISGIDRADLHKKIKKLGIER